MAGPTVPEIFLLMRERGAISGRDHELLSANYSYFLEAVSSRRSVYVGRWVGVLNRQIYDRPTYRAVVDAMRRDPMFRYAYIEQIP
jgi:hypothetical protein